MWKRRIPAERARSLSAARSAMPTPWCCQRSTTSIATSAVSKSSSRRMYRAIAIGARGGGEYAINASWCQ